MPKSVVNLLAQPIASADGEVDLIEIGDFAPLRKWTRFHSFAAADFDNSRSSATSKVWSFGRLNGIGYGHLQDIEVHLRSFGEDGIDTYLVFRQCMECRKSTVADTMDLDFLLSLHDEKGAFIGRFLLGYWARQCGFLLVERRNFARLYNSINPVFFAKHATLECVHTQRVNTGCPDSPCR